jgi:hypothetical protein
MSLLLARVRRLTARLVYIYLISLHTLKLWHIIKSKNKCKDKFRTHTYIDEYMFDNTESYFSAVIVSMLTY